MRGTTMLGAALKMATAAALGLAALGVPVAASAETGTSGGTWAAAAQPFPGFSASNATLQAITCPSLGNCIAVGYTSAAPTTTPIVSAETNGVWGSTEVISGTGSLGNGSGGILTNVSCGGPGDCTATGTYHGTNGVTTAFYVSETAGKWGIPAAVTSADQPAGTYSEVNGLSCGAVGYCAIVGRYTDQGVNNTGLTSTPFTLDEANGTWGTPQPVPGLASLSSAGTLDSVSCTGASDCSASGESGGGGSTGLPFVVSETGGTWGNAEQLSGTLITDDTMISCPDPADCAVAATHLTGNSAQGVFTFDEANGAWDQPQLLTMPSSETDIVSDPLLSCRSAGNCVILGNMDVQVVTGSPTVPFAATETTSGAWGAAAELPGITPDTVTGMVQGLSCVPGGDCTFAVSAQPDSGTADYIWAGVSSADGSVGTVQQVYQQAGFDSVVGLSCPQSEHCTLAADLNNKYMLGTEATASTVTLTASAPEVTYGAEQSETLTATASSAAGGTPTGTATVTDGTLAACTITLTNGTGSCTLTASALPVGTDQLTAAYSGDAAYAAASGTASVTVGKGNTAASLALAKTAITYGAETAEKLTATVSHAGNLSPTGTVQVKSGSSVVCTITLAGGAGSCTLTASRLVPLTYHLAAVYSGDGNYLPSTSAPAALTVAKAKTATGLTLAKTAITYGHETAEKLTATVSRAGSAYPAGTVQVKSGTSVVCTITLAGGAGSCTLTAKRLVPRTYHLVAVYLGNGNYLPSTSAAKTLTVAA